MSKNLLINANDMSIFEPRRYYQEYEGTFITATDKSEDDTLDTSRYIEVTEIWGNTVQDENNLEDIQSVGELYVDDEGNPILDELGREQYKIKIESCNKNLFDKCKMIIPDKWSGVWSVQLNTSDFLLYSGKTYYFDVGVRVMFYKNSKIALEIGFGEKKYASVPNYDKVILNAYIPDMTLDQYKAKLESAYIIEGNKPIHSYIPHQSHKTTILLPCQLQKVGDVYDRLYWDSKKGKYVVEKNTLFHILDENKSWVKSPQDDEPIFRTFSCVNYFENIRGNNSNLFVDKYLSLDIQKNNNSYGPWLSPIEDGVTIHWEHIGLALRGINNVSSLKEFIKNNKIRLIIPLEFPQLIETNITEKIQLPCYSEKTHIFVNSTVDAAMKALVPYKEII